MKEIKLSGRERAVLRYLDWSNGTPGVELLDLVKIDPGDLVDVLNGLMEAGYLETVPYVEQTTITAFRTQMFEVNPSYALDLRAAIRRN
jgi:hypothetical protein